MACSQPLVGGLAGEPGEEPIPIDVVTEPASTGELDIEVGVTVSVGQGRSGDHEVVVGPGRPWLSRRHGLSIGSGEGGACRSASHAPLPIVDGVVVLGAQQEQVVDVGRSAEAPPDDVVGMESMSGLAAGESAMRLPTTSFSWPAKTWSAG